jgi:CBS domain-containing protein
MGVAMRVSEILRIKGHRLCTVTPDTPMKQAVDIMSEQDVGSLVVLQAGEVIGMLTFREVLNTLSGSGSLTSEPVRKYMNPKPLPVSPEMEVNDLRRLMLEKHARYVPVIGPDRKLIGVMSFYDVAKAVLDAQGFENKMLKAYISGEDKG